MEQCLHDFRGNYFLPGIKFSDIPIFQKLYQSSILSWEATREVLHTKESKLKKI